MQTGATSSRTKVRAWNRVSFLQTGRETSMLVEALHGLNTGTHDHKDVEVVTAEVFEKDKERRTERKEKDATDTSNSRGL